MIVKDLVETRELLSEEVNDGVVIIYERFENVDCHCDGEMIEELECDPEEMVQLLRVNPASCESLKNIKTYTLGKDFQSVEDVIDDIRINYSSMLNREDPLSLR
ncbi:hypothetical protein [Evansella halocellulosilytica]|uniref:hypothetical protein n=1 Tax=Evansella halocellulosilytica TaxID=2011013 RepID=UPI000BB85E2B|nr:hypothetical protein [Evansella halocellulosilytica]